MVKDSFNEWKYAFLMSCGEKVEGEITFFSFEPEQGRRGAKYYFFDNTGTWVKGDMKIPHTFGEDFEFEIVERAAVAYDPENSEFNIIVSPEIEKFNLKRR